jgi:hypothetical protein
MDRRIGAFGSPIAVERPRVYPKIGMAVSRRMDIPTIPAHVLAKSRKKGGRTVVSDNLQ